MIHHDGALGREESWLKSQEDESERLRRLKRYSPQREPTPIFPLSDEEVREKLKDDLTEEAAEYGQTYEQYKYYLDRRHLPMAWVPIYKGPRLQTKEKE